MATRAEKARDSLETLRTARPEHFDQCLDTWLSYATASEVRHNWRKSWGKLPSWARK